MGAVNTALPPETAGNYPPDGAWDGLYCTAADVFARSVGLDWSAVHREMCKYGQVMPTAVQTVADLITQVLIPDAEAQADGLLRQSLKPTQATHFLSGSGDNALTLPYTPVLSVDQARIYVIPSVLFYQFTQPRFVKALGRVNPDTDYRDADLLVDPETGRILIPAHVLYTDTFQVPLWNYSFLRGDYNIEVTWTYGLASAAAVPRALREATALLVAVKGYEMLGAAQQGGVAARKVGGTQVNVGREKNLPYGDLIARLEAKAFKLLRTIQNAL